MGIYKPLHNVMHRRVLNEVPSCTGHMSQSKLYTSEAKTDGAVGKRGDRTRRKAAYPIQPFNKGLATIARTGRHAPYLPTPLRKQRCQRRGERQPGEEGREADRRAT